MKRFANEHPYEFAVALFVVESLVAVPVVLVARIGGIELEPLRLVIPIVQSVFVLWVIYLLGWFRATGFVTEVKDVHVYWFPVLYAFVPVVVAGSIAIPPASIAFYMAALFFTGLSEEGLGRGLLLRTLLPKGKWIAIGGSALLFSAGHFSNLVFEDFSPMEMAMVLAETFSFGVLYGAVFLRTLNIWPLIVLHTVNDYSYVTSGTAGPFTVAPMPTSVTLALVAASLVYAIVIARRVSPASLLAQRAGEWPDVT